MLRFLAGFVFAAVFMVILLGMKVESSGFTKYFALKEQCEKSLPRNQTCVLIAVPKQETIQEK